ncbi:CBS domain-containing protein [Pseudonocardia sp. CA-107938]|uniref:CBS domain-containing protein n=1 Tax=Pseudonocardia sp. CA-107938 TaxID=3240021 RepID=UPI003D91A900
MHHVVVSDVMTSAVVSVRPQDSFAEVARVLSAAAVRAVPVLSDAGTLLGVVSEADLMSAAARPAGTEPRPWWRPRHIHLRLPAHPADATTAEQLMSTSVETVRPWTRVAEAARRMRASSISWMPVTEPDGRVVGVLSRSDVLRVFLRDDAEIRAEIERDVLRRALRADPGQVRVDVTEGVVTLTGELGTHSAVEIARHLVRGMDGVVAIVDHLRFRVDDRRTDVHVGPFR